MCRLTPTHPAPVHSAQARSYVPLPLGRLPGPGGALSQRESWAASTIMDAAWLWGNPVARASSGKCRAPSTIVPVVASMLHEVPVPKRLSQTDFAGTGCAPHGGHGHVLTSYDSQPQLLRLHTQGCADRISNPPNATPANPRLQADWTRTTCCGSGVSSLAAAAGRQWRGAAPRGRCRACARRQQQGRQAGGCWPSA